jgi:hypothetical protein
MAFGGRLNAVLFRGGTIVLILAMLFQDYCPFIPPVLSRRKSYTAFLKLGAASNRPGLIIKTIDMKAIDMKPAMRHPIRSGIAFLILALIVVHAQKRAP